MFFHFREGNVCCLQGPSDSDQEGAALGTYSKPVWFKLQEKTQLSEVVVLNNFLLSSYFGKIHISATEEEET